MYCGADNSSHIGADNGVPERRTNRASFGDPDGVAVNNPDKVSYRRTLIGPDHSPYGLPHCRAHHVTVDVAPV